MSKRFTSTVAGASILLTSVGLLSRGLGLIRESVFANYFGLSPEYDLYLVSVVLPMTINTVVIFLGQNFFIPIYHQKKTVSENNAKEFLTYSFILFIVSGLIVFSVLFMSSTWFLKHYISGNLDINSLEQAVIIFKIYISTIPLSAGFSILAAYLQAEYNFIYPSVSILILNITVIVLTVLFTKYLGILVIPAAYLSGILIQFIFLFTRSRFRFKINSLIRTSWIREYLKSIKSSFILIILIEAVGQAYLITDRYFFHQVDPGGIAALNYSMILFNLPISIFSVAFATALFPSLSENYGLNNKAELKSKINQFFCINSFIFIPIAFCYFFWGNDFIKLFFERGKFSSADTLLTFSVLRIYSIGLIFYSAYALINKLFYASQMIRYLLILSIFGLFIKILLNFLLVVPFAQEGLAMSTSITYVFFFVSGSWLIFSILKIHGNKKFYSELILNISNIVFCLVISHLIFSNLNHFPWIYLLQIIFFLTLYLFNAFLIKHDAINIIKNVKNRII